MSKSDNTEIEASNNNKHCQRMTHPFSVSVFFRFGAANNNSNSNKAVNSEGKSENLSMAFSSYLIFARFSFPPHLGNGKISDGDVDDDDDEQEEARFSFLQVSFTGKIL